MFSSTTFTNYYITCRRFVKHRVRPALGSATTPISARFSVSFHDLRTNYLEKEVKLCRIS